MADRVKAREEFLQLARAYGLGPLLFGEAGLELVLHFPIGSSRVKILRVRLFARCPFLDSYLLVDEYQCQDSL